MVRNHRHGALRQQVYEQVRDRILSGHYPDGSALTELRISQDLGVSRTPVREAFGQLELDGLVVSTPNKSVQVQRFSQADILDLYQVRGRMESLAAGRAATMMTATQIDELHALLRAAKQATLVEEPDISRVRRDDYAFHDLIFAGANSKVFLKILQPISIYTQQARSTSLTLPGRMREVQAEHERIFAAIEARDSALAEATMREHIANAAQAFTAAFKKEIADEQP